MLADPVFSRRVFGLKRHAPVGIDPATVPNPTAVLVSHAHYDHFDVPSYKYLSIETPLIVPPGYLSLVRRYLPNPVIELTPGARHALAPGVTVTATPARHPSWRLSGLRYRKSNGYLIALEGKTVYFAGDTAYAPFFRELGEAHAIDAALLPIGAYRPEWFMRRRHLNPDEALQALEDLKARRMIPIHYGCFRLSLEPLREPLLRLELAAQARGLADRVRVLQPGESLEV